MNLKVFCYVYVVIQTLDAVSTIDEDKFAYYKNLWLENLEVARSWKQASRNTPFEKVPQTECKQLDGTFDFVVVGGGTAGSVLANLLSADPHFKVLVLEAGGSENDFTLIPGAYLTAMRSEKNWGYVTEPQTNACGMFPNSRCNLGRGRILGGETAMKDVTYIRGNLRDFDDWGSPFWAHHALRYFKTLENATALNLSHSDEKYRGFNGKFHIEHPKIQVAIAQELAEGFKELGYELNEDPNGATQMGISRMQSYTVNGQRGSTAQRYLQPVLYRNNLKVITRALVSKIRFANVTIHHRRELRATHLEYLHGDSCYVVSVTKEIILTSGPINTPQLLMLSGVGPKEELSRHGIPIVLPLPAVGQNLEDHVAVFDFTFQANVSYNFPNFDDTLRSYLANGTGSLAEPLAQWVAFINTKRPPRNAIIPNVEIFFCQFDPNILYPPGNLEEANKVNQFSAQIMLLHPKSKGSVSLVSANPVDHPKIDPRYLEEESDLQVLLEALKFYQNLVQTKAYRSINATFEGLLPESCAGLSGDQQLRCVIKNNAAPMHHQIGTCRMGRCPKTSCVDHELKVHGVQNLRVVDSSVIPQSTSGHTVPVVIMMAEAIADQILRDHGRTKVD